MLRSIHHSVRHMSKETFICQKRPATDPCVQPAFALCAFCHKCCGQYTWSCHTDICQKTLIYVKRDLQKSSVIMSHRWLNIHDYLSHPIFWVQSSWLYILNRLWHPTFSIDDYYAILYSEYSKHVTDDLLCVCTRFQNKTYQTRANEGIHRTHVRTFLHVCACTYWRIHMHVRART